MDVVLSDAFGQPVDKENEVCNPGFYSGQGNGLWKEKGAWICNIHILIVDCKQVFASLLYADTRVPVENTTDDEAPLLASYDGIEFSSHERPSKLLLGRASFKLKISQVKMPTTNVCLCHLLEFIIFLLLLDNSFQIFSWKVPKWPML